MNEKNIRQRVRIGVIGGGRASVRDEELAVEVGRRIAEAGAVLVCGGLSGVMRAAARGAREAGGLTVGILPGTSAADANPFIDVPVATGLGYSRNALVVMNSDALIAVAGEFGTLSEIAFGNIFGRTVIGLGTWEIRGVRPAGTPEEAVRAAMEAAERRPRE